MTDFNINLAKTMVSSPEERQKFYNRMLIYLVTCAALMVYVAFLSSRNLIDAVRANRAKQVEISAVSAISEQGKAFYRNPDQAFQELEDYARDLETLRASISQRAHFLPVLNQLFKDFPDNVALQNLSALSADRSIEFGLVAPLFDPKGGDPVAELRAKWKANDELDKLIRNEVEQLTIERRMVGETAAAFVKFKCDLK